jgi:protein-S-isoprenylcysteine O-methyltransferase Ste14
MTASMRIFLWIGASLLALLLTCLGVETLSVNLTGWFLVITGLAYLISILGGVMTRRQAQTQDTISRQEIGDRSFWLILPGFLAAFLGSPLEMLYMPAILPRYIAMQWGGIILLVMGTALLIWAGKTLRRQFTGHVQVTTKQRLVREGPYHYLRHPGYAGYVLIALGLGIGYSSLVGLIAIPLMLLPGLAYRMRVEEKHLIDHFGDEYRSYMRTTSRLIPGVW